jgi:hypothetical protein
MIAKYSDPKLEEPYEFDPEELTKLRQTIKTPTDEEITLDT